MAYFKTAFNFFREFFGNYLALKDESEWYPGKYYWPTSVAVCQIDDRIIIQNPVSPSRKTAKEEFIFHNKTLDPRATFKKEINLTEEESIKLRLKLTRIYAGSYMCTIERIGYDYYFAPYSCPELRNALKDLGLNKLEKES